MTLPNADRAFVPDAKLSGYSRNPHHPKGKHKARVFASVLGLAVDDADWLEDQILRAVRTEEVTDRGPHPHGERFVVDFPLSTDAGTALVRTTWIVRHGETHPRLTSCFVR